ncbi:MAG: stage II sporulation protein R [Ruminococcaceae bacterium]|nr:stage II sporulation protein R [Oscillospiraceae bacterium]
MKKIAILCTVILISFSLLWVLPVHGEDKIYDSVIRLHVLANSDSEEDQSIKLSVRDEVAKLTDELTEGCTDIDTAEAVLRENLGKIEECAKKKLDELGCSLPVRVELGRENYPTKSYESICFPAGNYRSLRVMIGEAEGQNWWCVLFPQLCLGAASAKQAENAFIEVGFTPEQYKIITKTDEPQYKLRFKILEALGGK